MMSGYDGLKRRAFGICRKVDSAAEHITTPGKLFHILLAITSYLSQLSEAVLAWLSSTK